MLIYINVAVQFRVGMVPQAHGANGAISLKHLIIQALW